MNYQLKVAILKSGETQTNIARKVEISEARLSRIIRGYWLAKKEEKDKLSKILDRPVEELFPQTEEIAA